VGGNTMKRKIYMLLMLCLFMFNIKAYAAGELQVEAEVKGKIEKGEQIEILINIKDIGSFFAGQVDYRYDPSILKITKMEPGELISDEKVSKFDAINKIDEASGTASYAFSSLGKVNGFSGSGTFVKITAEVLKKEGFFINSKPFQKEFDKDYNMKLIICDSNIKELDYKFTPYKFSVATTEPTPNTGSGSTNTNPSTSTNQPGTTTTTPGENKEGNENPDKSTENNGEKKEESPAKPTDNKATQEKTQNNEVKTQEEQASNQIIYILAAIILLSSGAAGYIIYKKKKSKDQTTEA
jgi:hypothetical protein